MKQYSGLIKKAVKSVSALLGKRNEALLEGRNGKLVNQDELPEEESDYELVTWLIIK
jgi:hypothetical protein